MTKFAHTWLAKRHESMTDQQLQATAAVRNKFTHRWRDEKDKSMALSIALIEACEQDMMMAWDAKDIGAFIKQWGGSDVEQSPPPNYVAREPEPSLSGLTTPPDASEVADSGAQPPEPPPAQSEAGYGAQRL
jgi:hypothetical protein